MDVTDCGVNTAGAEVVGTTAATEIVTPVEDAAGGITKDDELAAEEAAIGVAVASKMVVVEKTVTTSTTYTTPFDVKSRLTRGFGKANEAPINAAKATDFEKNILRRLPDLCGIAKKKIVMLK